MKNTWLALTSSLVIVTSQAFAASAPEPASLQWFRGNTHTHTLNSDCNAAPYMVVRWYREHGYQFVFVTDHEIVTDSAPLNGVFGAAGKFLVMPGQEVSQILIDPTHPEKQRHAHINALGITKAILPMGNAEGGLLFIKDTTMAQTYSRNMAEIRAAGGIPQVDHPNFRWSVKPGDLAGIAGPYLLEIWNGHSMANNLGGRSGNGEAALSTEELWDVLLSQGETVWGVASDDSHDYLHLDDFGSERPGKAWIVVRAAELTSVSLLNAIRNGQFYASNGVSLEDYMADRSSIVIAIKQSRTNSRFPDDRCFLTRFIGRNGKVLSEVGGSRVEYRIRGDEGYVRASITDSNGQRAWTQPVFLDHRQ